MGAVGVAACDDGEQSGIVVGRLRRAFMSQVQADPALQEALSRNGNRVELVDAAGKLIGIAYRVPDIYLEEGKDPYDRERMRAALANPKRYTTEEFLKGLGLE
jgi:hypothetical protein